VAYCMRSAMKAVDWCGGFSERSLNSRVRSRPRLVALLVTSAVCLFWARVAAAQTLAYSGIDRATVRVTVLAPGELTTVDFGSYSLQLVVPIGHGSGVILGKDGLVVTAAHVVAGSRAIAIHVPGTLGALPADVVHLDASRDFAVLHVAMQTTELPVQAPLDEPLRVRQTVYAIGYPLDATRDDPQSARGVISGLTPGGLLQVDMSLNPGNSGGPIVDEKERVQGIVVARGRLEKGVVGVGLGVPQAAYRPVLERIVASGEYLRQSDALRAPGRQRIADLVALAARRGLIPPTPGSEKSTATDHLAQELERAVAELPTAVEPRLLLAALEWNRYAVLARGGDPDAHRHAETAVRLCRDLVRLDPGVRRGSPFVGQLLDAFPSEPGLGPSPPGNATTESRFTAPRRPHLLYARVGGMAGWAAVSRSGTSTDDYSGNGFTAGVDVGAGLRAGWALLGPYFRWQSIAFDGTVTPDSGSPVHRRDSGQFMQIGGEITYVWRWYQPVAPIFRGSFGYARLSGIGLMRSAAEGVVFGLSAGADLVLGSPAWHLNVVADFTGGFLGETRTDVPVMAGIAGSDAWFPIGVLGGLSLTTP
jgi:hypothetical protein